METRRPRGRPTVRPQCAVNRLREYRQKHGKTQKEIADLLGVPQSCVSEAERINNKSIGADAWDRLADLFGVDPRILKGHIVPPK